MPSAIICDQLCKTYDDGKQRVEAVKGLNLAVESGVCFGLLGPNGAGKTTTVEILEGLLAPTSGTVELLGMRWGRGEDHALRQRLGITLQETKLQEKLTVMETLQLFRSFYDQGKSAAEAMAAVGLEDKAGSWVRKLSGGQKQRLAVACALVGDPELLFLDEPTTGLDPQARRQLWEVINNLKRSGCTILLTTHYMDEAERLSDHIAIIDRGTVIAEGTPRELISGMGGEHIIEFDIDANGSAVPPQTFEAVAAVRSAMIDEGSYLLTVTEPHRSIPALLRQLERDKLELTRLTTRHLNLEDVFVRMTGRHLSD